MKFRVLNLALCIGMANAALAADQSENTGSAVENDSLTSLDTIIVSGEKQDRSLKDTVSSVSVIGEETLRTTQNINVRDAIEGTPNVVVQAGLVPTIRGAEGNGAAGGFYGVSGGANARVSMLVDGVADPFLAVFAGDSGLWDVEQIEVYRGPQSTNNGRNSVAGAIHVKTKDPTFDWEGAVRLGYRNKKDYFDKAVMVSGPVIDDILAFRFSGQMLDAQTLANNEEYAGNPADYDLNEMTSKTGRFKALWTPNEDLQALFTYSTADEEGDIGRRFYTNTTDYILAFPQDKRIENDSLSLKLDYQLNASNSLELLVAGKEYLFGYESYEATAARQQDFSIEEDNLNIDAKLNFGRDSQALYGHVGLAYFERDQEINSTGSFVYDGDDSSESNAAYAEVNYALSDKVILTGGMRYQQEDQQREFNFSRFSLQMNESIDDNVFLPSAALQYDITEDTRLGFSAKKGYNSGGFAVHPVVGTPFFYDKETVNSYELTARSSLANGAVSLRANLFFNDYNGYQASNGVAGIANVDAETYGLEAEAITLVTDNLELSMGLGLLRTEITNGNEVAGIDGNDLSVAPKVTGSLGATYFVSEGFDLGARLKYTGSYFIDLTNTESTKAGNYTTVDLTANYETGPWLLAAFVKNATNKEAVRSQSFGSFDVLEPRTVGASVTYSFF